ncbi:hypothetical protein, partial [Candidatus Magnetaquicoccus inordinatus]|uniref:hypothetical protein n=1 Tax=Candidatus Magnetaquicoccus inordinatus TaxID=2496818 RepID=UPI00187D2B79
ILVKPGRHQLRVELFTQQGDKAGTLHFPEIAAVQQGTAPLYTASVPIKGRFTTGLWFFKIQDQIDHGTWYALDTLAIMVLQATPETKQNKAQPRQHHGEEDE